LRLARGCLLALVVLAAAPELLAQAPLRVSQILITNVGPTVVSDSIIRANIRVKEGDPYSRASVDDDVRSLYATGYFRNIRVEEEPTLDGVRLLYTLQGRPKVGDIVFTGNKKYGKGKLTKKLTTKIGDPLEDRKLFADAQEIKKMYQKAGYPKTEVEVVPHINTLTGRATVTFEIKESQKVRIADVVFEGAQAFKQSKLRKVVKTRRHWMFSWITGSGVVKDDVLDEDKDKIAEFYRSQGYIDFELKDVTATPKDPRHAVVRFIVHEGKKYQVGAVTFKGNSLFTEDEINAALKMKVGDTFTPGGLRRDIEAVQDLYGAKGYIDTEIRARRNANIETGTIDLGFELEERNKSYIEKIEIRGNVRTKDRVIRRELAVSPGEVFDLTRVKLSKRRLENLNYFERVDTQPAPTDVPDRRNLEISVIEKNTGQFSIGAGFSSVNSIIAFVEVTQGNFDLFNPPSFIGGGQKMRLRATLGFELQDYQLTFIEPWFFERKLQFSTELYHRDYDFVSVEDTYSERRTGGRIGLTRALGSDFLIGGISYTLENVGLDVQNNLFGNPYPAGWPIVPPIPPGASEEILREDGDRLVSKVGASLTHDTTDSPLLPSKGHRTEFRTEFAGGPFGGQTDFYKIELRSTHYFPGFLKGHLFEVHGHIGVADFYGDSDWLPLFDSYFLGGINDMRGYKFRQVGPKDEFNEPIGGGTYWYGSAEYSVPIIERLRFALFYDVGMVYRDAYSFDHTPSGPDRVDTGFYNDNWGVGLRLNLPIGPLRLDYGIPITADRRNDSSGRFQFSVGYRRDY